MTHPDDCIPVSKIRETITELEKLAQARNGSNQLDAARADSYLMTVTRLKGLIGE